MRWRTCLLALLTVSVGAAHAAASAERDRLATERREIGARYAAEEHECRERFVVTSCIDDAKARRRSALASVRAQELELDDAERKRRAAERVQAIERRREQAESNPPAPPAPEPVVRRPPAAAVRDVAPARRDNEAAEAAHRVAAAERRREAAEAEQEKIRRREVDRAARKKPAAPLPPRPEALPP